MAVFALSIVHSLLVVMFTLLNSWASPLLLCLCAPWSQLDEGASLGAAVQQGPKVVTGAVPPSLLPSSPPSDHFCCCE